MAKREISIVLKAKNELMVGLSKAKDALESFGSSVMSVGKWVGGAFVAAGAAVAGFVAKSVSAYAQVEMENVKLAASFRAFGEEVDRNVAAVDKFADAIERETGVTAGNLKERAARLKMLGVETQALESAVRATVALAAYNVEEEAAIRAVALAHEGNYDAIKKYIPALREITDESVLAAEANDFLNRGYLAQSQQLDTISGRWGAFKESINQVWEGFGELIAQNETVQRMLEFATEKVRVFVGQIGEWAKSQQFQEIQQSIEGIINAIAKGGPDRQAAIVAIGEFLKASLARGAEVAGELLKTLAPEIGKLIGAGFKMATQDFAKERSMKAAASELGMETGPMFGAFGGFMGDIEPGIRKAIELRAQQLRQEELFKELGIEIKEGIDGQTAAQARLAGATEALLALGQQHGQIITRTKDVAEQSGNAQIQLFKRINEEATKSGQVRLEIERATSSGVINTNSGATESIKERWQEALENYLLFEEERVNTTEQAVDRIISANARAAESASFTGANSSLGGGSFESDKETALALANLRARGIIPPSGSRLAMGQTGDSIQRAILAELTAIRTQNTQLLTFS